MTPWLWWLLLYRVKRFSLEYRKISIMASKLNARYLLILREVKSKTNCDSLSRFLRVFCQLRVFSSSFDWLIGWFACFVIGQGDNNNGSSFRAAVERMKSGNYFGFGFGSTAVWDWLRSQNCCVDGFVSVNNTQLKTALFPRLQRFFLSFAPILSAGIATAIYAGKTSFFTWFGLFSRSIPSLVPAHQYKNNNDNHD